MASVYGAVHPIIGKKAADKVLASWLSSAVVLVVRFIQEARAVNAIGHPNTVYVFAFGKLSDGRSYFIMEWLKGRTLEELLGDRRLAVETTLDIIEQTSEALEAAHQMGIVHRDLKPANVFLVPLRDGRCAVKLLDFGVAKLTSPIDGIAKLKGNTANGQVVGTPEYIAPEQARGLELDGRADLYSLGVMAYEMVLGRRPFESISVVELMNMQVYDAPPPPRELWPEIPPPLEALLLALLSKSADERPSLREIRRAIAALRQTALPPVVGAVAPSSMSETLAPTPSWISTAHRRARRTRSSWLVAAAALVAVAMAAIPALRRHAPVARVASAATADPSPQVVPTAEPEPTVSTVPEAQARPRPSPVRAHKHASPPRDTDYLVNPFSTHP